MKRNYKILLAVVAISAILWSFIPNKKNDPDPVKESSLIEMLMFVVKNAHYDPAVVDDAFSKEVYARFLENLDPNKRFFYQSDIDEFSAYELKIDDQIAQKKFDFFNLAYGRLQERIKESEQVYKEILAQPLDFTQEETIETDFEKQTYAKNKEEWKNLWRKQLKLQVLGNINEKEKIAESEEKKAKEDKKELTPKPTFAELEKDARETTLKSLEEYFDLIDEVSRTEWFSVYINSILEQFDPHTNYFAPDDKQKFDESMSGSMEGIGASLKKKNDYIEISEIIPGGPAWRDKQLESGDLIMKVAQANEQPVDIAGKRLDKVVKLIKGKKGTQVTLTVKKVDGTIKNVTITRDKFEIEETYAKSSIIETKDGKYGMIYLPKFYVNFETKGERDAFTDVAKQIELLKKQNIKGLIIDLRNNGGGSLQAVVDMVGLFIEKGPVVQVRKPNGRQDILSDRDPQVQWNGPLVVMINNYSASASEIFAAAIQDYNRGIVVGSKHSFGKGTVQNMFSLNDLVPALEDDFGALKFTSQKFYRINGGSTQLKGVESDIVFPDRFSYIDTGEKDQKNAMKWDKISQADYKKLNYNYSDVISHSLSRIKTNEYFKLIDQGAKWASERKDDTKYPLKYETYKADMKKYDEINKKYNAIKEYKNTLKFESLPEEIALFANDTVLKNKRDRWHENLKSDIYLEESVNVIKELAKKK